MPNVRLIALFVCLTLCGFAQNNPRKLPFYNSFEEYCAHNPTMPNCKNGGKRIDIEALTRGPLYKPPQARPRTRVGAPVPVHAPAATHSPRPSPIVKPALISLGEPDWRFAHPNPDMVGGIKFQALMESPLVQSLLKQVSSSLKLSDAELRTMKEGMSGLSGIRLSLKGDDVVVLMVGDVNKLESMGGAGSGARVQVISLDQALAGKEASLIAAARRMSMPTLSESATFLRARTLAASNDVWFTGSMRSFTRPGTGMRMPTGLSDLSVTLSLRDDLLLQVIANTTTVEAAQGMVKGFNTSRGKLPPGMAADIQTQGKAVTIRLAVSRQQLEEGVKSAVLDPRATALVGALRQASGSMPTAPSTPQRSDGKIKIHGLSDGPREVELKNR